MNGKYHIDPNIKKSRTLPAAFYRDEHIFEKIKEEIFYRSWQWVGHKGLLQNTQNVFPLTLLDGFLTEPLVLTKDKEENYHCLSNVCTHRANIVANQAGAYKKLNCRYHGRRFALDGRFEFMPEFEGVENFPSSCDNLHEFPLLQWGPCLFAGLNPAYKMEAILEQMDQRVGFLPLDDFVLDAKRSKDYFVNAHWALYCDNYLEGFHIPFVHQDLNTVLNYGDYETLLFDQMNLQIGYAKEAEEIFDLPSDHIDFGKRVAAYYFWVFPNMMFNFYPWGLSVNIVEPLKTDKTRVRFLSFVNDRSKLEEGAGAGLNKVEMEDEEVVEGVQLGVRSKFYQAGRFSPTREKGVHHFHGLLAHYFNKS
ncbi:MAG: aromatic ring-hydroxylating dioxygenase subunit alpha [Flavobacteriaceae bacterium]